MNPESTELYESSCRPLCLYALQEWCVLCVHLCVLTSADGAAGQPESIWYGAVELTDDFVYSFLPAGVAVPPSPNSRVELPQSHLGHLDKPLWDLRRETWTSEDED